MNDLQTQSGADVHTASELEQAAAESETVEVFVRMDAAESDTYARATGDLRPTGDSQATLQREAEITQSQLELHADERGEEMTIVNEFWITNAALVEVDSELVDDLARIDGVTELHPNYEVEMAQPAVGAEQATADDVGTGDTDGTYGLDQINAPDAWDEFDTTGEGVTAAVIDSGLDADHPEFDDFDESNWAEFDFDGSAIDSDPYDVDGHGTHVAGTVLGGDASGQHIGVAPDAELLAINVFPGMPEEPSTTLASIVAGIEHAVEEDADVANLSLGGGGYAGIYIDVIKNAKTSGTLVVSSSGNDGPGSEGTPANVYDNTAVGASDVDRQIAGFSTGTEIDTDEEWGFIAPDTWPDEYATPDVSAPGVDVYSSVPGGEYSDAYSGTSMAAPHVTGAAALLLAHDDDLEPSEAKSVLEETATKPYHDDVSGDVIADAQVVSEEQSLDLFDDDVRDVRYGYGIIDVYAASATIDEQSSEITGEVVDEADDPVVAPTRVTLDETDREVTHIDDRYGFAVTEGEYELAATDAFGYTDGTATVSVDAGETAEANVDVERTLEIEQRDEQPTEIESAAEFDVELEFHVAHLENVSVDLADEATVDEDDVTVEYDGSAGAELTPGETHEFKDAAHLDEITVSADADVGDTVALEHTFEGLNSDPINVETGPTTVVDAPEELEPLEIAEHERLEEDLVSNQMRTGNITVANPADEPQNATLGWDVPGVGTFADEFEVEPDGEHVTDFDLHLGDDPAPWSFAFQAGDTVEQELILLDESGAVADSETFGTELVAGSLSGTVTDADTGAPVSGATVTATDGFAEIETVTDSDGQYNLQPDAPGEWYVTAEAGSYAPIEEVVTVDEDLTPVEKEFEIGTEPAFTHYVDAGETATVGLPADIEGGTVDDIVPADANVVVWAYDHESNEWESVDGDHEVGALDALAVSAAEDTELTVRFAGTPTEDAAATPAERDVDEGWNFVAPSTFDDADDAFASTSEVLRVQQIQDQPQSEMVPDSGFDGVETLESNEFVNPFAGYFAFVEDDGTMAGATHDGMTLLGAYDALGVDDVGSLEGTVTSSVTGDPVEDAEVSVAGTSLSATTDADGTYSIPAVVNADEQRVTVDAEGYDGESVDADAAADIELQDEVYFEVTDIDVSSTELEVGETFDATYTIENKGSQDAWQIVTSEFGDAVSNARIADNTWEFDSRAIDLEAGGETTVELEDVEVGEFVVTEPQQIGVVTDDEYEAIDIAVTDPDSTEESVSTAGVTAGA